MGLSGPISFMENVLEILGVLFNIGYLIGIMYRRIWCWPLGILGSGLGMIQMYMVHLYSETILYFIYFAFGFYGWYLWNKDSGGKHKVEEWKIHIHLYLFAFGTVLSLILGFVMKNYTNAVYPYIDASTTIFSLIATWLEAKKILSGWYYWIALNGISIWMYYDRELKVYAALMILYTVLSIVSLIKWRRAYLKQA